MAMQTVEFHFISGLQREIFRNARLLGSWDGSGRFSESWTQAPMQKETGEDGCPIFKALASFDPADRDKIFRWGVVFDGPQGTNLWGIPTEIKDSHSAARYRQFRLNGGGSPPQIERYYFTYNRRLGANKHFTAGNPTARLRFSLWAPHAQGVEVVFATTNGYISDDGSGIDPLHPPVALKKTADVSWDGIWQGEAVGPFESYKGLPYMYRILNAQGHIVYRTDIFSRSQAGRGDIDPAQTPWPGTVDSLDGTVSCSVVIDPDVVRRDFASTPPGEAPDLIPADEFWTNEYTSSQLPPSQLEDLLIYELHIGSLGFGKTAPGNLTDALDFLDHLADLGVNAVELLPMAEFSGNAAWGYGDTHHFCIESSAGGRDKYRHFVRECHRRGIAVIQDVVYNHYDYKAERAQYNYDSTTPEQNIYYWYEGQPTDYTFKNGSPFPDGGYLDNGSSGFAPCFWQEIVRQQFISSAVFLLDEMHVDGLRVDLTQAIHRDNRLHADGRSIGDANLFGQKFLREWSRTLHMIKPTALLIAEDHTGWEAVTKPPAQGGLGFNARWEVAFYHNLIGDSTSAGDRAHLLKRAGFGTDEPLRMDCFAGALYGSRFNQVVFHESHDEAGNEHETNGTERTMVTAVNGAALVGATRLAAEARARLCFGFSLLSAGTPMFFMGEEIGAQKRYTYNSFMANREDILSERNGSGKALFCFYQDIISLSRRLRSVRSHNIDILHHSNANRVIAFKRWSGDQEVIVVASLNNTPFLDGYLIEKGPPAIANGGWKEIFNSDSSWYGGRNIGNNGTALQSCRGCLNIVIPANGFILFIRQ